ncbi:hypothetical protein CFIMG_003193RA [Ceratocystis fimbriata CBS 114723]|uniref:CENP-T/Histone H4 histone fold domain-containing protein n=1 Tax=Ceratocystis fimbriata CBS 114723 TaxID=1035309 RepID=A0A2C5XAG3_9PEZI|nr:hypothetical protein CFIMG_003193RA [Ceratocystis fimbriata CBS 114723]
MSSPGSSPPPTTRVALATPARPTGNSAARAVRTPLDKTAPRDLLNSVRRGQSSVRNRIATNAPTPHARAAIRALDMRRAAVFTPGKGRRKSVRDQRETPRDILRMLSRSLAPASQAVHTSSSSPDKKSPERSMVGDQTDISNGMDYDEDDDDDVLMRRPEFTLPLDEGDEEDDDLVAPRSMLLEDETMGNLTMQSMEFPRRATNDILVDRRLSRMSMGSVRFSDVGLQPHQLGSDDVAVDSGFFPRIDLDDVPDQTAGDLTMQRIDDTTGHDVTSGNGDLSVPEQESLFVELRSQSPDSPEPFGDISQLQNLEPEPEPTQHDMSMEDDGAGVSAGGREFPPLMQLESEDDDQGEIEDIPDITFDSRMEEQQREARKKGIKLSAYGIEYPSIPPSVVKRLALMFAQRSGLGKCKISPETLQQLSLATDWFFEQVGSDLKAYAEHANRKTIDESDVALLMRRQRQISSTSTLFSQAHKYLPRELLQEIRMPAAPKMKKSKVVNDGTEETDDDN